MKITSFSYKEFEGETRQWVLEKFELGEINLFVGVNSSGKSRIIAVLKSLAKLITGQVKILFVSGDFSASFDNLGEKFDYEISFKEREVAFERLTRNGEVLFSRNQDGIGKIKSDKLSEPLDFEVQKDALVINVKRDKAQHGFIEVIHEWASQTRMCLFGSTLGKERLVSSSTLSVLGSVDEKAIEEIETFHLYSSGYEKFGDAFDKSILSDFSVLGYQAEEVGMESLESDRIKGPSIFTIFVKENDLLGTTNQVAMSQGMYRALALVIQLNYYEFSGEPRTMLIDDIGEGLDYDRSRKLIALLIEKAKKTGGQLLMTTNDRFVMNNVPLEYWGVVSRSGSLVKVINSKNSKKIFEDFESLGLNNFDFFANKFFELGLQE